MKKRLFIWICSSLFVLSSVTAQKATLKKADRKFDDLAYIDALDIYEKVADKGFEDADLFKKLGDGYYFNADYTEAAKWYGKLAGTTANLSPEYQFRYGQSLKANGNYKDADVLLKQFYSSQGLSYANSDDYLSTIEKNSNRYISNSVGFNTKNSDYPAFLKGDELYVISGSDDTKRTPWNDEPTSDIFKLDGGSLDNLGNTLNTRFNEGSLAITKDGKTMFFTRNDYDGKKRGKDQNKTTRLKLYIAQNIDGNWDNVIELPFNNSDYSIGHPALSADDSMLYFVSDMPGNGSKGGTDIYQVTLMADGSFGAPLNMSGFNTPGDEMFPFVAEDGTFYFASNGHVANLGGLDIYSSKANDNGDYGKVSNMGKPINSPMDDFALMIHTDTKKGYFASNRIGSQSDDIYSFAENENYEVPCSVAYRGVVRDKKTGDILDNVLVSLINANNEVITQKVVSAGLYEFDEMDCQNAKFVRAEKNGYQTAEDLTKEPLHGISSTDVLLDRRTIDLVEGNDIGLILNPIFFDLDKDYIRPDAEVELQKVIAIMRNNPSLKIDVRSHTDSRASDSYNMNLSNRRAQSTINYIARAGIDRSRLTGRGYGETQLKNGCSNGVGCSDIEHQRNRRSEFIIVK
ncbi:MAG: OmpA family protein [Aureisphaera sp.]